ncbi:MAG TPA: hypothetical protein VGR26_14870 [Acidimicrobiales bacterium]|nr:hypothetical protein [Acidimicrobiales bacterium]
MTPHEALAVTEYRQMEMTTLRALVPLELPDTPPEVRRIERVREAVRRYWIEHPPEQPKPRPAPSARPAPWPADGPLTLEQWRRVRAG